MHRKELLRKSTWQSSDARRCYDNAAKKTRGKTKRTQILAVVQGNRRTERSGVGTLEKKEGLGEFTKRINKND